MSRFADEHGAFDLDKSHIDYAAIQDPGHGNSPAGWTCVFIMMLAFVIGTIGVVANVRMALYIV